MARYYTITFYVGAARAGVGTVVFTPPEAPIGAYFLRWDQFTPFAFNLKPSGTLYEFENINTTMHGGISFAQNNNTIFGIFLHPGPLPRPATLQINAFMGPATLTLLFSQGVNTWTLQGGSEPVQGVVGTMQFAGPYQQPG